MNEFATWELIGTFAGATIVTTLLVQFFKLPLDKIWKIPTRYIVFAISATLLLLYQAFFGVMDAQTIILTLVNAVFVGLSAMGAYELIVKKIEEKLAAKSLFIPKS